MLTDAQIDQLAQAYTKYYRSGHGARRHREVVDPPGLWYGIDSDLPRTGDAGFFVSRWDGRVIPLGSGHFTPFQHNDLDLTTEVGLTEVLKRILAPKMTGPGPLPDKHGLRVSTSSTEPFG
jgi:hypothetical protein